MKISLNKIREFLAYSFVGVPLIFPLLSIIILSSTGIGYSVIKSHLAPPSFEKEQSQAVLGESTGPLKLDGIIEFGIPAVFNNDLTVNGTTDFNGPIKVNNKDVDLGAGKITATNIVYGLTAGAGIGVTTGQNPTITNTGVTSFQGKTGAITFSAGSGISIDGTTITNSGSNPTIPNSFGTISDGTTSFGAGSTNDTVTLAAGSGVTITTDTTSKKLTFSAAGAGGLSGLTTDGVLYATSGTTATTLAPSTSGFILQTNGAGIAPSWVNPSSIANVTFANITTGTNTTATMTVGNGAVLTSTGTGIVNANEGNGQTLSLGGTVTTGGAFTTTGAFALSFTLAGATTLTLPTSGTLTTLNGTEIFTNKTIAAGSNTITGLTNGNLSGTAGITGANIANNTLDFAQLKDSLTLDAGTSIALQNSNLTLGNANGTGTVVVSPNAGGQASLLINNQGSGDLLTASAGATPKFTVQNNGNIVATGTLTGLTGETIASGGLAVTLGNVAIAGGNLTLNGTTRISNAGVGTFVANTVISTDTFTANTIQDSGALTIKSASGSNLSLDTNGGISTLNLGTLNATAIDIGNHGALGNSIVFDKGTTGNFTLLSNGLALDCSGFTNSGKLTTDSSGNITCANDASAGAGTFVSLAPGIADVDSLANPSIFINDTGGGNLLQLQHNGNNAFVIDNSGSLTSAGSASLSGLLTLDSSNGIQTTKHQTLIFGGGSTGNISLLPTNFVNISGNLLPATTDTYDLGSSSLEFNNLYVKNISSPSLGGVAGYWQLIQGALSPTNITNDLLVGAASTSSAKFQVFALTGNATTSGNLTFNTTGSIQTTNNQTLTLGGATTGNILLSPLNGNGSVTVAGLATGIVHSTSGLLSSSAINLAAGITEVTGTLPLGNGGTGTTSFTQNGILYGNAASTLQVTAAGTTGQVLGGNTGGAPTWQTLTVSGSGGGGGGITCSDCLVNDPTSTQTISPTGASTVGLSVKQTSAGSPTGDIFNVTNSGATSKYLEVDSLGNLSVGGTVSFTNSASTTIGTSIANNWVMNSNSFNSRRSVTITNNDNSNVLPANYEVTLTLSGATAISVCNNTRNDNDDLRISYGVNSEIARDITRNCNTSVTITFLLQSQIAIGGSDTYYIYYSNPSLSSSGPTYAATTTTVDNADVVGNFTTSDVAHTPISQDTGIKQEGTGSVKVAVSGGVAGITPSTSTGADGTLDLSLGSGAGGCTGTGLSWNAGSSTCTINDATKSSFNFTTINIPIGTVLIETGTTAVPTLLATGNVTIGGSVTLDSTGFTGQNGPGAGGSGGNNSAGGAGYGGAGGAGTPGTSGPSYTGLNFGSGGGNSFAGGGAGGGGIQITTAGNITVSGTISANAVAGACLGSSCSGGGSGGGIMLQANNITVSGTVRANGANGGTFNGSNFGGGGGGGRIWMDYGTSINTAGSTITVSAGTSNSVAGNSGVSLQRKYTTSINQTIITTKSATDLSSAGAVCFYARSDTTGQYLQFGFGQSAITEQTYNITISSANTWIQQCFNVASIPAGQRQNITKFGFTVNNIPTSNFNFWFDIIVYQTTAGFTGVAPTVSNGATVLGTQTLTLNGQGLGGVNFNYDPSNALAGSGGLNLYNGGTTSLFSVDGSGNASASGTLTLAGAAPTIKSLNGANLSFQTSVGGDTGLTTRLTLLNNGNFGIGTTSPGSKLDVMGGTVGIGTTSPLATLDVQTISGTQPIASFSGATSFAGLIVDNSGRGDIFTASSSGLNRFVISQAGNVGIGNNTPTRALDIAGNVVHSTNGLTSQLSLRSTSDSTNKLNLGYDTTSNYGFIEAVHESVAFQNLYLQPSGGSVGINSTYANSILDLGGGSGATNKLLVFDDNSTEKFGFGAVSNALQIYAGGSASDYIQFGGYNGTTFTEKARIQNGNLGINVGTTPLATLDVRGTSGITPIASFSAKTSFAGLVVDNSGAGDIFTASTSGQTRFVITNQGNVGIGTRTPTAALDILGSENINGYASVSASLTIGSLSTQGGIGNGVFSGSLGIGTNTLTQTLNVAGSASIYNATTGRGDIYTVANLDKTWNTTALFNSAGATFSANMVSPASNNQLAEQTTTRLASWNYDQPVTINNLSNSNTLTNYQIQMSINTAALVSAGKMNASCSDMRFTDSDGSTVLSYWIESGCNTSTTTVWVKVPSITASSNKTIYFYYGNGGASSLSSTSTFIRTITNVQAAYRIDEASGTNVADYSGNSNNGTATGTSIVSGQFNNARSFAGGSDNISTGYVQASTSNYTVEAWVKTTANSGKFVQDRGGGGGGQSISLGLGPVVGGANGQAWVGFDTNGTFIGVYTSITINDGNWHHVVGTWGGTNGVGVAASQFHIYVDGINKDGSTSSFGGGNAPLVGSGGTQIGNSMSSTTIDEVRIYNSTLSSAEVTDEAANYGYVTTNSANSEYVRKFSSPEPTASFGIEDVHVSGGVSTDQTWTSDTLDAGVGNLYRPNFLTVNYTDDGSDNVHPKFQLQGSNTGSFTGEQTVYPNGYATYYQSGGTYTISSGVQKDISTQITSRFRFWKVIAFLNTGATVTDTPIVSSVHLQDNQSAFSFLTSGNVGIGTTAPAFKLDVSDGASATVSAMIRNLNPGTTASGLGIQLGAASPGTNNYYISFLDGNGEVTGKIQGNGSSGVTYNTAGADFAEYFAKAKPSEPITPGTIVCQDITGVTTCNSAVHKIIGVVSQTAGFVGNGDHGNDDSFALVGLVGQLPVQYSTASGSILPGDTLSVDNAGNAVKATNAGQTIGTAIQGSDESNNGKILVHVNVSWFDPLGLKSTLGVGSAASLNPQLQNVSFQDATVSGTLTVLGRTVLSDLGVTGNIQTGILAIHGLEGEIDTVGQPLKLQANGTSGVDILAGKVVIDTQGDIKVQGTISATSVETGSLTITNASKTTDTGVLASSTGVVTIPAGKTSVTVTTSSLTSSSRLFVTPDIPVAIGAKISGTQSFTITLGNPQNGDLHINWWIVH